MFSFLKEKLKKIYAQVTAPLAALFARSHADETLLADLERLLLEADTGTQTTRECITYVRERMKTHTVKTGAEAQKALTDYLREAMRRSVFVKKPHVYIMVGVNGTGKTTFAAKLAALHVRQGKKVLLAAADTFRAAATEQLTIWAERAHADIILGKPGQDPASVVFAACQKYKNEDYDILIIDTAGRLQNKSHLLRELEKIGKITSKFFTPDATAVLLTVDALLGQNSIDQARLFNQALPLDGIVLTKTDGTGKGGAVFALSRELAVPVAYISYGEGLDDIDAFSAEDYICKFFAG